ncbi:MAG: nucleoside triphosphate pyrophosphohydrolase [Hyphomicrobiaceae bacterium]
MISSPKKSIQDLIAVMAALRNRDGGCPWDLEQNFASIAPYTIEEAYEVADAIARGDMADLKEELGDLLLQVVYHARLAEEDGDFDFSDVADGITRKMIRRHPHVFGDAEARSRGMAKDFWERIKAEERAEKARERARLSGEAPQAASESATAPPSLLGDIPVGLPGLTRAIKLQDKAARVGFDWPNLTPVLAKLREEAGELEEAIAQCDAARSDPELQQRCAEELGDLLFVAANIARHLEVDPEAAIRAANRKFERRFRHIETELAARGSSPEQSTLEEMDAIWNEAKSGERK